MLIRLPTANQPFEVIMSIDPPHRVVVHDHARVGITGATAGVACVTLSGASGGSGEFDSHGHSLEEPPAQSVRCSSSTAESDSGRSGEFDSHGHSLEVPLAQSVLLVSKF